MLLKLMDLLRDASECKLNAEDEPEEDDQLSHYEYCVPTSCSDHSRSYHAGRDEEK
jgi:hypothetical protein